MHENNDSKTVTHNDSMTETHNAVTKSIPLKFQCSKCGACCRRAGKSGFMPDRGDGACVYLTQENECSIYNDRPDLCNMEKMWKKRNEELDLHLRGINKKEYFKMNSEVCNEMIDRDQMEKSFLIDLSKYEKMEE